jgi:hypothetical protein
MKLVLRRINIIAVNFEAAQGRKYGEYKSKDGQIFCYLPKNASKDAAKIFVKVFREPQAGIAMDFESYKILKL